MKKRILALLLALTMAFSLLVFPASAANEVASGKFQDSNGRYNLKWVLTDDGTMTISGSGYITSGLKNQWAEWDSMVKSIVIERGPTVIQSIAFQSCKNVESVTIPGSVGRIESGAFSQCTSLKHVTIPEGVYTIEGNAFYGCSSLKNVTIPASVTSIGEEAFRFCSGLESVTISNGLKRIENKVFSECSALKSITIPESVTEIGFRSFFRCDHMTSVTIPTSVTSIFNQAFYECDKLADVYYGGTEEQWNAINIGVSNGSLTSATLHCAPAIVDSGTCGENVTWVLTDDGVLTISGTGEMASTGDAPWYDKRDSIQSVVIEPGVTSIGYNAFDHCGSLTSVAIPDSVTSIGTFAFLGCSSLTSVVIPASVTSIGLSPFIVCGQLQSIEVDAANPVYRSDQGVLMSKDGKTLIACPNGISGDYQIPDGVTTIGENAFLYCEKLESVTIPDSVTTLGRAAFGNCFALTNITIPNGVTCIPEYIFAGCEALREITIPSSVTSVESYAFYESGLTDVYYGGTEEQWNAITIGAENAPLTSATIHYTEPVPTAEPTPVPTAAPTPEPTGYPIPEWSPAPLMPLSNYASVSNTRANIAWLLWRIAGAPKYTSSSCPFPDMPDDYEHYAAVMWAYENGVMNGYPDGSFLPDGKISRAEAAAVLYHFENGNTPLNGNVSSTFEDVSDHDWACPVIMWFASDPDHRGDYTDTHFYPTAYFDTFSYDFDAQKYILSLPNTDPLYPPLEGLTTVGSSRAELVWLLWRINGAPNYAYESVPFADVSRDADYYSAVAWAYHNGVMVGTSATTFDPDTHVTRAQYAVVLYRLNGMPAVLNPSHVFEDVEKGSWYYDGVCWFADQKDFGEYSDHYFCPFDVPDSISYNPQTGAWIIPMPNPFVYRISGGMAIIDGYKESIVDSTDVVIPETLGGFPVGSISSTAFTNHHLTSISIPVTVSKIDSSAFSGCSSLTEVFYAGNRDQWAEILIGDDNEPLTNAVIHFGANTPGRIVTDPENAASLSGGTAVFSIVTAGDVVSYQWQASENGGDWADLPDGTAATLTLTVEDSMSGNQYRCVVTDKDGNSVTSEAATLTVAKPVVITGDPSDNVGKVGRVAGFVVEAEGVGLTYLWEYSDDNGATWNASGNTSAVAVCKITEAVDGRLYRCVVTDQFGNQATSASATLRMRPELTITVQPKDYEGKVNSTAKFTIGATGENVTYQWQISDDGGETWTNSSVKATKYSTKLTAAKHERMVRCIVTDIEGCTLTSDAVSMKIAAAAITSQPQNYVGKVNTTAKFTVTATGAGLAYQWQVSDDGGETWSNSSVKDASYSTKLTKAKNNRMVRCIVTDQFGNEVISDTARMTIG